MSAAFEFDTREHIDALFERLVAVWCLPSRPDRTLTLWHRTDPARVYTSVPQGDARVAHFLLKRFEALSAQLTALVRTLDDPRIDRTTPEAADLRTPPQEKTWQAHLDFQFDEAGDGDGLAAVAEVLCGAASGDVFFFPESEALLDYYLPAVEAPPMDCPITLAALKRYEPEQSREKQRYVLGC